MQMHIGKYNRCARLHLGIVLLKLIVSASISTRTGITKGGSSKGTTFFAVNTPGDRMHCCTYSPGAVCRHKETFLGPH